MTEQYDDNEDMAEGKYIVIHSTGDDNTVSTRDIPDQLPVLEETIGSEANTLLMMLPGQTTPLTFVDVKSIILGRYDPTTGLYPTVDLIPYFGKSLGVSRRHAEIILQHGHYYVRDLDSANGTWLNNRKMTNQPEVIKSGDQLRLGELLIVLFLSEKETKGRTKQERLTGQHTLYLQYYNATQVLPPDSMTVEFMNQILGRYLQILSSIQSTIFDANKQDKQPITISSIQVMDKPNTIEIQLHIHPQLLFFLRDVVQKRINQSQYDLADALSSPTLYSDFAQDILSQLTPSKVNDDQYVTYVSSLEKDLQKLFAFDLKMVSMEK
ncbi:MAG: FHA domain-containing protein [bacterium]|nr:FHA domain-containing protein [bacterium]